MQNTQMEMRNTYIERKKLKMNQNKNGVVTQGRQKK